MSEYHPYMVYTEDRTRGGMPMEERRQVAEGFLTMAQAQEELGVSKATMQKLVRNAKLKIYRDQRDNRMRLVKVEDLHRLREPVPDEA